MQEMSNYPELMKKLLARAGVKTAVEAERYLEPDYLRDLHDPFLLKDMDLAVERIMTAVKNSEPVVIFADYDADGVPGAALLATFFKQIGFLNFDVYIPDRHNEAYGLSEMIVKKFAELGKKLIITIDCGITDVAEVKLANRLGLEVIVTDHHLVQEKIPPALAIVNPKQVGDEYPEKMLCGCGVVFKLVQALIRKYNANIRIDANDTNKDVSDSSNSHRGGISPHFEKWLLDLVAISTVSDMVPMAGENRTLTYFGLKVLRQTRRLGLNSLLTATKLKRAFINEDDIGFTIGPRINTASRMSHASQAYFLLTTADPARAQTISTHLCEKNADRRAAVDEIITAVNQEFSGVEPSAVIVIGADEWSLGVLGLAAARLVEKYQRPVFLWGKNGQGDIKGSCRGDGSINVVELMTAANEEGIFIDLGGHAEAGGFSLHPKNLKKLGGALIAAYKKIPKKEKKTDILVDDELTLDEVTLDTWKIVEAAGPYGIANPKPVFLIRNLKIEGAKIFGNGSLHLELTFKNSAGKLVSAIGFFSYPDGLSKETVRVASDHRFGEVLLEPGNHINLLANLELSYFKFWPELRLRIVDVQAVT